MREDWIETTLDDIAKWGSGGTPKSTIPEYYDGDIPWLIIGDLNDSYVSTSEKKITELGLKNSSAKWVKADSVLIAMYGSIGKLGINKIPVTTNQAIAFTQTLYGDIQNKYLFYYLLLCRPKLHKVGKGGTQKNISQTVLKTIDFPLAPLLEQKAIVAKIEQLFSELDNAVTNLKTAQAKLKIYRQAVLKKAFDLNNKSYLLEEISEEIFAGGDKPKDYFSEEQTDELQVPIYANAVANRGLYGYTKEPRVIKQAITVAGRGSGTGHIELRNEPFVPIVRLITIVPNLTIVDLYYLMYFLKNLNIQKSGSAIPQLTIPMIKEYRIHLPSMTMQKQIVQEIESKLSVCDKIEETIETSLAKSEALRQSILKKAFEGKLLSEQELENIKNHPEYESAETLLENIKKERTK